MKLALFVHPSEHSGGLTSRHGVIKPGVLNLYGEIMIHISFEGLMAKVKVTRDHLNKFLPCKWMSRFAMSLLTFGS